MSIEIVGIDKAVLLQVLHNNTKAIGMGHLHDLGRDMTYEEAKEIVERKLKVNPVLHFDYVCGRPIKVTMDGTELREEHLYDRDTYPGACAEIINGIYERMTAPVVSKS